MGNCCQTLLIKGKCSRPPRPPNRLINVGVSDTKDRRYPNNEMISSRYTVLNFIFKNLFEQFQRIANFYFLCIAIIQLFIDTPVSPLTSIAPLIFVLLVTMVKQGHEDVLRHRADRETNNRVFGVFRSGKQQSLLSKDICVGDLVMCQTNDPFPCDLVLIASSDSSGECYVTTASLDGETNLKIFSCVSSTKHLSSPELIVAENIVIHCPEPTEDLYKYSGRMETIDTTWVKPLSVENLLLQGARLKNTEYIYGCAVYTGFDTKLSLNSKGKKHKVSQVEQRLNVLLIVYLILLSIESTICTALKYGLKPILTAWYVSDALVTPWVIVQDFLGYIVLFNYLIPISLYVTIEIQKYVGSIFFGLDIEMYDPIENNRSNANTSDLNEELGQIEYLFSDKTGTLTQNRMVFQRCSVTGIKYIEDKDIGCLRLDLNSSASANQSPGDEQTNILGPVIEGSTKDLDELFRILALCHTARAEQSADKESYLYQASSPDEKAFLEVCHRLGIVFTGDEGTERFIQFRGQEERYQIMLVLEFDSDRKCMSIILQYPDGSFHLHCKGAESTLIAKAEVASPQTDVIMSHVMDYALLGLRTLVFGTRALTAEEAKGFIHQLNTAKGGLDTERGMSVAQAYANIEKNLRLVGCTAVEDKLQDGVPETIRDIREAGIKVWVLTGDKEETAVNISYSAGHFNPGLQLVRITQMDDIQECNRLILSELERIETADKIENRVKPEYGLVIDGQSLVYAMQVVMLASLMKLIKKCVTVLCCRMTPLQKAEIIIMVRKHIKPEPITAAIGDGANDVSMILEAHVGFGLFGKEGRQAVRASDYCFTYFRSLRKALFVHGYWYYHRIAILVQYFFYKNIAFITAQFYYSFFSAHSAQTIYQDIYLLLFNLTLTSLPILLYGFFEQPIDPDILLAQPKLYLRNRRNAILSWPNFIRWNFMGVWHSVVAYFGIHLIVSTNDILSPTGLGIDVFSVGTLLIGVVVSTVTLKLMLETYFWQVALAIGLIITGLGNLLVLLMYSGVLLASTNYYWSYYFVWSLGTSWLGIILLLVIALTPDILYRYWIDRDLAKIIAHHHQISSGRANGHNNLSFETELKA